MTDDVDMTERTIRQARTPADFAAMAGLVSAYLDWCRVRYTAHPWFIERVFDHQSLAAEIGALSVSYTEPRGKALLAEEGGRASGIVAYRRLDEPGVCEMKRLFVADGFNGRGTGRRLAEAIVAAAREDGFQLMRLDTGHLMAEATAMYESIGFHRCPPYHDYPSDLLPFLVFMELPLGRA